MQVCQLSSSFALLQLEAHNRLICEITFSKTWLSFYTPFSPLQVYLYNIYTTSKIPEVSVLPFASTDISYLGRPLQQSSAMSSTELDIHTQSSVPTWMLFAEDTGSKFASQAIMQDAHLNANRICTWLSQNIRNTELLTTMVIPTVSLIQNPWQSMRTSPGVLARNYIQDLCTVSYKAHICNDFA